MLIYKSPEHIENIDKLYFAYEKFGEEQDKIDGFLKPIGKCISELSYKETCNLLDSFWDNYIQYDFEDNLTNQEFYN